MVDPRPYMTYQPFLPEVAAGSVEARHAAVSLRRHLHRSTLIAGTVTAIDHAHKQVDGAAGPTGTTRRSTTTSSSSPPARSPGTFPIPGVAEQAIGLKHVEEAVAIRDRLLVAFDRASALPPGPERQRLLTRDLRRRRVHRRRGVRRAAVAGHGPAEVLPGADARRPELPPGRGQRPDPARGVGRDRAPGWCARWSSAGARSTSTRSCTSAEDGHVVLSDGDEFDSDLIVWTAGNAANPVVAKHTDLPVNDRGLLVVRADLRIGTDAEPVPDAWAAGDDAAVPDLTAATPGALTVPNAQHAVRQGRLLARNIAATLRGRRPKRLRPPQPGRRGHPGPGARDLPVRTGRDQGLPGLGDAPRLPRAGRPTWERKVRVLAGLDAGAVLRSRHRLAAVGPAPPGRLRRPAGAPDAPLR